MRIWFVNHYALPPGASGGPTRHLGLARALHELGHEVVIHASLFDHYTRRDHRPRSGESLQIEDVGGVTYVWWPTPAYGARAARIRNMLAFARSVVRHGTETGLPQADVVIGSSPHLMAAWAAGKVARQLGVPFVLEVRDLWPDSLIDLGGLCAHHPMAVALRRLERSMYRSADHVVVVPPHAATHVAARGGHPDRISHIPNGVDLTAMWSGPDDSISETFSVVYAGTLGHANGLELAVEMAIELAARGRDDIAVRLVGAGPDADRLRTMAARVPTALITVEPAIPANKVPALLATAGACLLVLRASPVFRWGVSPTKLFDYLAAGKPVVASVSAPDDIVGPAQAGLWVRAGDARALADAVEHLADLPLEQRVAMGRAGRRYVEEHHSFASLARQFEAVLEECRRATVTSS